jgi:5-methylcytosine-specific restriction endonuclease McrA
VATTGAPGHGPSEGALGSWEEIRDRVEREFLCLHGEMVLTVLEASNGVKVYKKQCPTCGELGPAIPHAQISYARREAAIPRDDSIRKRRWEAKSARYQELRVGLKSAEDLAWWESYSAYLETPAWRRRRAAVLRRDEGLCQGCLAEPATQVHHLTYDHVGDELLFELISVCDACHRKIHPDKFAEARA